jgi:hypothetical protein
MMIKKSVVKRLIKEIIWTHILYGILIVKGFDKPALAAWVLLSTLIAVAAQTYPCTIIMRCRRRGMTACRCDAEPTYGSNPHRRGGDRFKKNRNNPPPLACCGILSGGGV